MPRAVGEKKGARPFDPSARGVSLSAASGGASRRARGLREDARRSASAWIAR